MAEFSSSVAVVRKSESRFLAHIFSAIGTLTVVLFDLSYSVDEAFQAVAKLLPQ